MRFAPTAEQADLRAVVHDLVRRWCPPAVVRAAPGSPEHAELRARLAELGVHGLLTDLELDENHLVPVMVETGWAAVPLPLVDTVAFGSGVLAAAGLPTAECVADPSGRGLVRHSGHARTLLSGGFGGVGPIRVVDLADATREPVAAVDPAADLHRVAGAVTSTVDDPEVVETAWLRGVLAASAQLVGLARRMLETTVEYVGTRRQFGVPVGSFQAVKHRLADAYLEVEFAAPAVARAGFSLACRDPDRARDVSMAKALASGAALTAARAAIQCHGAIAYTTEYDLHLYAKRTWALAADWGSAAWHRAAVAAALGLGEKGVRP